jgi:hypothetical protein
MPAESAGRARPPICAPSLRSARAGASPPAPPCAFAALGSWVGFGGSLGCIGRVRRVARLLGRVWRFARLHWSGSAVRSGALVGLGGSLGSWVGFGGSLGCFGNSRPYRAEPTRTARLGRICAPNPAHNAPRPRGPSAGSAIWGTPSTTRGSLRHRTVVERVDRGLNQARSRATASMEAGAVLVEMIFKAPVRKTVVGR